MNDKTLYELCVASGFTESQWWAKDGDCALVYDEHGEWWWCANRETSDNARARILAALVEWGTADDRRFCGMDADWVQVHTQHKMHLGPYWIGSGENLTLALLACFKSWKESQ